MKKWLIPVIIIALLAFGGYTWVKGFYNTGIQLNENVAESWGNVETAYQRRGDLIGNLVKTVQGAADFEKETLTSVIEARAKATSVNIDPSNITPEQLSQFNQVQGGLSGALKSLLVTVERYPDLKANQNFLKLQDELASTENQILTARTRFNEAIKPFNNHVKTFPNNILAGFFDFDGKPYFEAEAGTENAPDVEFDFGKKE
ncbi:MULTISPECIES: LemA family protein [Flavobacteriaceae]|uniref:LemA family protein n=2 Tax=Flavobacteriaceae TaxID=49546 RepID=A0A4Y8ASD4_9FLAO|nr:MULTISPECIES: LemA family protein [Flavobacteriaceae]TEW74103.1 LemA family protein [Gramella jeungdoensis]GGK40282.1 LemA family protein [Lutibacter litoralis]